MTPIKSLLNNLFTKISNIMDDTQEKEKTPEKAEKLATVWKCIEQNKDAETHAMQVGSGVVIRVATRQGVSSVFIPKCQILLEREKDQFRLV